jgi:hypothetical protein
LLEPIPVHFKFITLAKATSHEALMFLHKIDSALIQFTFEIKPLMPIHLNFNSPEMDRLTDNQDYCDNYIKFD